MTHLVHMKKIMMQLTQESINYINNFVHETIDKNDLRICNNYATRTPQDCIRLLIASTVVHRDNPFEFYVRKAIKCPDPEPIIAVGLEYFGGDTDENIRIIHGVYNSNH